MGALDYLTAGRGCTGVIVNVCLASQQQVEQTLQGEVSDLRSPDVHPYAPFSIVVGQT
jgi:hypothetical protein